MVNENIYLFFAFVFVFFGAIAQKSDNLSDSIHYLGKQTGELFDCKQ
jgi:hypothetical protein